MVMTDEPLEHKKPKLVTPTQFFLRGLAISLPSILTVVILIWIARGVYNYIVYPASTSVRYIIAQVVDESRASSSLEKISSGPPLPFCGDNYAVDQSLALEYNAQFFPSTTDRSLRHGG